VVEISGFAASIVSLVMAVAKPRLARECKVADVTSIRRPRERRDDEG
jgi:hypothetical protein